MPCYTKIGAALESGKFNLDILERALKALGFDVRRQAISTTRDALFFDRLFDRLQDDKAGAARGSFKGGDLEVLAVDKAKGEALVQEIRRAYTREAITLSARRHGLKVEVDAKDPMVLRLGTDGRTG